MEKKKAPTWPLALHIILGGYFLYKGLHYVKCGLMMGYVEAIAGAVLIVYSIFIIFKNKKADDDADAESIE